ncbi:hypothetical protein [Streptomyces sp. NBC_00467]|uniref:hypothetical protein n=1 Tax=Streptomyces sp. NBC_00467 TaxID=2975752 RepID=UPI002E16F20C
MSEHPVAGGDKGTSAGRTLQCHPVLALGDLGHRVRLNCVFGSGGRDEDHLTARARRAGLRMRRCMDIGWDHRMLVPTGPGTGN